MKLVKTSALLLLASGLAACGRTDDAPAPTLHEIMAGTIDTSADVIWQESTKAYGEDGHAREGQLADGDWKNIADAARKLGSGARLIAADEAIAVVRPGMKILDEGVVREAVTAAQVEQYVARDRIGLARHANELAGMADQIEAAARARNAKAVVDLSERLDDVCESCHVRFWYPDQKK